MSKLLLATGNEGKVREYRNLLKGVRYQLVSLAEEGIITVVDEVGSTLEENASLKASVIAKESRLLTLADDSGLEVDALDGKPGPLSARFAGENATDRDRIDYLLSRLKDVPWSERTAHFRCVIALASPGGNIQLYYGDCSGLILFEPRGESGFGYDPVFYIPSLDMTMAELTMESKNRISHRGLAAKEVYRTLIESGKNDPTIEKGK